MIMADERVVCTNRRALHDYTIEDRYEAGLVLEGAEVKSLRQGNASIKEAFARIRKGEVFLHNMHVAPYEQASQTAPDPRRTRKLLLRRREIAKIAGQVSERGQTIIPLRVYFKGKVAKVELGVARAKRKYDKRRAIAEREAKREIDRARKWQNREAP